MTSPTTAQSDPAGMASEEYVPPGTDSGVASVPVHVKPGALPAATGEIAIVTTLPHAIPAPARSARRFIDNPPANDSPESWGRMDR